MIVPVPVGSPSVTETGLESVSVNVSSGSSTVSPLTVIATVFVVSPGENVTVPLAPV